MLSGRRLPPDNPWIFFVLSRQNPAPLPPACAQTSFLMHKKQAGGEAGLFRENLSQLPHPRPSCQRVELYPFVRPYVWLSMSVPVPLQAEAGFT